MTPEAAWAKLEKLAGGEGDSLSYRRKTRNARGGGEPTPEAASDGGEAWENRGGGGGLTLSR